MPLQKWANHLCKFSAQTVISGLSLGDHLSTYFQKDWAPLSDLTRCLMISASQWCPTGSYVLFSLWLSLWPLSPKKSYLSVSLALVSLQAQYFWIFTKMRKYVLNYSHFLFDRPVCRNLTFIHWQYYFLNFLKKQFIICLVLQLNIKSSFENMVAL